MQEAHWEKSEKEESAGKPSEDGDKKDKNNKMDDSK